MSSRCWLPTDRKRAEYLFWSLANIAGGVGVVFVEGLWLVCLAALFPATWIRYWMLGGRRL